VAVVLLRLRLALQLGGATGRGVAVYVLSWVVGVLMGLIGGLLVAALDSGVTPIGDLVVPALFLGILVAWVVLPIATPIPSANLIDPRVLEQYPLSRGQQVAGLLLGGLATPTALATFLTAAGGVAATHAEVPGRIASVGAGLLFTVLCVAASYGVRALFAEALSARRGRDLAVILSTLVIVALYVLPHVMAPVVGAAEDAGAVLVAVLTWTPPGAASALGSALDAGDVVGVLARVGVILAAIALALLVWSVALHRHVIGHSARAVASRAPVSGSDLALVPLLLHPFRAGAVIGAASQHLRYYFFRAPRAAQFIILGPVIGLMFGWTQVHTSGLPFAASIAAVAMGGSAMLNLFGFDGRGVELTVQTGASLSAVLRGKLFAVTLFLLPGVAALTIGLGIAAGVVDEIPLALVGALAGLLMAVAAGGFCSAWNPYDQEAPQGDRSALAVRMLAVFAAMMVLVYGTGWLATWVQPVVPVEIVLAGALLLAAAGAVVSTRLSGALLDRDPARLLAAFTPR